MIHIPGFLDLVTRAWAIQCPSSLIAQFNAKLKNTKQALREFNKEHGNVQSNVQQARAKLEEVQVAMASSGDNSLLSIEKDLFSELNVALL